jgi:alkanesulfonate monooxygenase SsuD/methylene tetrahydromethanopterin reductase-like flavin-dependent oxidoreductase (luciferase family)
MARRYTVALVPARRAIFVAPFDELYDPRLLAKLAVLAEERGWDGFFLWDHIVYSAPADAVADPWVALAAVASATERIALGALVTPLPRRRVHKVARETVTLDHLSGGRLIFGAGLGGDGHGEFEPFGEPADPRERARLLDEGLERLAAYWERDFRPPPVQRPRIPVWVAGRWPMRRPLRRAAAWDGYFPIGELERPDQLAEAAAEIAALRAAGGSGSRPFDLVVTNPPGTDPGPWAAAGATWCLTGFGPQPRAADVRDAIEAGP